MSNANVVNINQNKVSVYSDIQTFLEKHKGNSEKTAKNYEKAIEKFFRYTRNKGIEQLEVDDLHFRNADVVKYQLYLKRHYSNSTVNNYMAAIASLYDYLERNEYPVKASSVKVDLLKDNAESYDSLTLEEAVKMGELIKTYEGSRSHEKYCFWRMAWSTSFRKDELLNLKWSNIKLDKESGMYVVHVIGKGDKKHERAITPDLYNELLKIKEQPYYKNYNGNFIFHLSTATIQDTMKRLIKDMGLEDRRIVFHSLRHVNPEYMRESGYDITDIREQLNHSNINTTAKKYLRVKKDYANMPSVLIEKDIQDDIFDQLTHEQLLQLVKGTKNGLKQTLKLAAKKLVDGK